MINKTEYFQKGLCPKCNKITNVKILNSRGLTNWEAKESVTKLTFECIKGHKYSEIKDYNY